MYAPINTDIVVATEDAYMFVTGPDVIKSVTGEDVSLHDLGSARKQAEYGNVHHVAADEKAAFDWVREYLSYMPSNCQEKPPIINPGLEPEITDDDLARLVHARRRQRRLRHARHPAARSSTTATSSRSLRRPRPTSSPGSPGSTAARSVSSRISRCICPVRSTRPQSDKAAHFVRICNAYNIPLVFVVDTPGFLPGVEQEKIGVIKRGGRFLFAYVEASVPKVTVVVRKSYGGGYAVMGSKQLGADINFAWPTARIAVMGAESAVAVIGRKQIAEAGDNAPRCGSSSSTSTTSMSPRRTSPPSAATSTPSSSRRPRGSRFGEALNLLRDKTVFKNPRKHHLLPL